MSRYTTYFGSIENYEKGGVTVIDEDPKRYAFSNIFEVAAKAQPYERVAVGKNFEYVVEAIRAEGTSPWWTAAHDEFILSMDGEIEVHLVKLANPDSVVDTGKRRSAQAAGRSGGTEDGPHYPAQGPHGAVTRWRGLPVCGTETIDGYDPDD